MSPPLLKCGSKALFIIDGDKIADMIPWDAVQKIVIETNDQGPLAQDMFWVLHLSDRKVRIPSGSGNENEFMDHIQSWPGFDNDAVIQAATCTDAREFICWARSWNKFTE